MSKTPLKRLRLRAVVECSFCRSEATNLDLFRPSPNYPGDLQGVEAFLFVSKTGNQVVFIFREVAFDHMHPNRIVDSRRLRMTTGEWNPLMLQNYANAVGLNLQGLRRFEEIFDDMQERKRRKPTDRQPTSATT